MARGDQFALFLRIFFFAHSAAAFALVAGLAGLMGRALQRPINWRLAGTIGIIVWAARNIYVHAMDSGIHNRVNMDGFWLIVMPAVFLLAVIWIVRLVALSIR